MIPTAALRHRIHIHDFVGTNGQGHDVFDPTSPEIPARLNRRIQRIVTGDGVDVIANVTCDIRPGRPVPQGSIVECGNTAWTVQEVVHNDSLGRPHSVTLVLTGERPVPIPVTPPVEDGDGESGG